MAEIKLMKNVVMDGKIFSKGEVVTIADGVDCSAFGEVIEPVKKKSDPKPEEPKRSRSKPDPKPEAEVEDGSGDNP